MIAHTVTADEDKTEWYLDGELTEQEFNSICAKTTKEKPICTIKTLFGYSIKIVKHGSVT